MKTLALPGLAALCVMASPPAAADDFLDPAQAFPLVVSRVDAHRLTVRLGVAPGYHLYRDRLGVATLPSSVDAAAALPPGRPEFDAAAGKAVDVYRDRVDVPVAIAHATGTFNLAVANQGCADKGLCYAPQRRVVRVETDATGAILAVGSPEAGADADTPAARADSTAPAGVAAPAVGDATAALAAPRSIRPEASGEGARIQGALRSGNLLAITGVFLLAGLLLSLTPCVLPMVPILSSIIVGQGLHVSRGRGLFLACSYCLGMALVYTGLGMLAGLAGEGLAAALQNAWVLGAFALLLAGFSLSMFGLYDLQLPGVLQGRVAQASGRLRGGRVAGVFAMGGLSALIVGPCVAAPLAGALVYISQTRDVVIGGVALFSLACGMSVPLLLVGVSAGELLPRAGAWMDKVKHVFGVLLLAVAIWLVSPVLPGAAVMMLAGALLLGTAVYVHAFDRLPDTASGWHRLFKGAGVTLALVGSAQWVGALSGGQDVLQPLAHLAARAAGAAAPRASDGPPFRAVHNVEELDAAVVAARRPVLLDFYADWCVACHEYDRFTFNDPQVRRKLEDFTLLRADVTADSAQDRALLRRFKLFGPPGIVFLGRDGRERTEAHVVGFQPSAQFLDSLAAAAL